MHSSSSNANITCRISLLNTLRIYGWPASPSLRHHPIFYSQTIRAKSTLPAAAAVRPRHRPGAKTTTKHCRQKILPGSKNLSCTSKCPPKRFAKCPVRARKRARAQRSWKHLELGAPVRGARLFRLCHEPFPALPVSHRALGLGGVHAGKLRNWRRLQFVAQICIYTIYIHVHTYIYINLYVYMYLNMNTNMYGCIYTWKHRYIDIYECTGI